MLGVRAEARARGGDRPTALRVARALLARLWPAQITAVRCERWGLSGFCGLRLSGVKFHERIDVAAFDAEVDALIAGAFAVDPQIAEVDLWTTVPRSSGKGAVVGRDGAIPLYATVYAVTAHRGDEHPSVGPSAFWDPAFRAELERGSNG